MEIDAHNVDREMRVMKPKKNPNQKKFVNKKNLNHKMVYNIWAINKEKWTKSNFYILLRIHFNKQYNFHLCFSLHTNRHKQTANSQSWTWLLGPFIILHFSWSYTRSCFIKQKDEGSEKTFFVFSRFECSKGAYVE